MNPGTFCCLAVLPTHKKNILFHIFLFLITFLLLPLHLGHCGQVTLAWDPVNASNLAGYEVYYGTAPGTYQWFQDVKNVTTYTLTGLTEGATYYAAAKAYNTSGQRSVYSNEVIFTVSSCTFTISPTNASFPASGGTGTVNVSTQSSCKWETTSTIPWITVNSSSGVGSGTISYTVSSNSSTTSQTARLIIAGSTFTILEAGQSPYAITASAGSWGSISPKGQVLVDPGAGKSFVITPDSGYKINNVMVDGISQGAIASYTYSNVQANHTISASFSSNTMNNRYVLSIGVNGTGSGGVSASPSRATYSAGTVVTLTATPDGDSVFSGWSGACSVTSSTCQVTMNSNLSVTASFLVASNSNNMEEDFNRDGMLDLLLRNKVTGEVDVWFMNGTSLMSSQMINPGVDLNWEIAGTGDFNNNGETDILWRNKVTGDVGAWFMNGTALTSAQIISSGVDLSWEIAGTGDFNNNGGPDILWRNKVTGDVAVWFMNGTALTSAQMISSGVDLSWEIAGTGDFNSDGKTDILWRNKVTGDVGIWFMNGFAILQAQVIFSNIDLNWQMISK